MVHAVAQLTIENTRMPKGSSRLLPTGKRRCRLCNRQLTSLFVTHTITVHNRSNAESIVEAMSESEGEKATPMTFAMSKKMFVMMLIWVPMSWTLHTLVKY